MLLVVVMLLAGCAVEQPAEIDIAAGEVNPWTHLEVNNDPGNFQFAIVTDRTGGHRAGVFEDAITKLNLLQPEFVMSVGDLIEGYIENEHELQHQWDEFDGFVEKLKMPFFYVPGNHDMQNPVQAKVWEERLGRSYYHFVYHDVLFLCLNTEDGKMTNISDEQVAYVKEVLAQHADVRWTLLFQHKPLWRYDEPTGFEKIEKLLAGREYTYFAGHFHRYLKQKRYDQRYFTLSTTGGGNQLRGPQYGEFDHVVWVTMTDDGPLIANLMLEGIWDEDVVTEDTSRLVSQFLTGDGIVIRPQIVRDGIFRGARDQLRIRNDSNVPLVFKGDFTDSAMMSVRPQAVDVTVPPNEMAVMDIELVVDGEVALKDIGKVALQWEAVFEFEDRSALEINGRYPVPVFGVHTLPHQTGVVLDGQLDEWGEMMFEKVTPGPEYLAYTTGRADASFKLAAGHDDAYVYIAVKVQDESIDYDSAKTYFANDSVELWVNADMGNVGDRLVVGIMPGQTLAADETKGGVRGVSRMVDGGYTVEFAVPLAYVIERQGEDWRQVRINVVQFDRDDDGYLQLWWQPSWRGSGGRLMTGVFERE